MAKRKHLISIITVLGILAIGAGGMLLLSSRKAESEKEEETVITREVQTRLIYPESEQIWIEGQGFLEPARILGVTPSIGGILNFTKDELKSGVRVEKNELLFSLDSRSAENTFQRARLELLRLSSGFIPLIQQASGNTEHWREYLELLSDPQSRNIPPPPAKEGREHLLAASQGILSAWHRLDEAAYLLDQHQVRAPFSGALKGNGITEGSLVAPGMVLAELIDTGHLEIAATLPRNDLSSIQPDAPVLIKKEGTLEEYQGKIARIAPVLQAGTATVYISITEVPESDSLLPGTFVTMKIKGQDLREAYRVPRRTLLENKLPVYRDGTLHLIEVEIIASQGDDILLEASFPPGTELVTTTIQTPLEGMLLKREGDHAPDA